MQTFLKGVIHIEMKQLNEFLIPFIGLKLGKHSFEYNINNTFFDFFDYSDFDSSSIKVNVVLEKKTTFMELSLKHKGTIFVPCDTTSEMFDMPIKGNMKIVVQPGEEFNNDNEALLILPHGEHQLDVSQFIYEMIVLSIPLRRVHPGIKDGTLKSDVLDKLQTLKVSKSKIIENKTTENTDPRWDKLKQLLTD